MLNCSLADNLTLSRYGSLATLGFIRGGEQKKITSDWMARIDVRAQAPSQAIGELSGGNQQKIAFGRLLHHEARILLLDEPTAGMSPTETARIAELIASLDRALTLVIVEHDMDVVFRLAERITVLHEGRVIAEGTPAQVRGDTLVNEVYLGKVVA